jgi:hypothetical protein
MPKDLPFGKYNIDHQIVTAKYCQYFGGDVEPKVINKSDSIAEIHFVIEGLERVVFLSTEKISAGWNVGLEDQTGYSAKAVMIQGSGDFIVTLPGGRYNEAISRLDGKLLKKVLISIPIQRIL